MTNERKNLEAEIIPKIKYPQPYSIKISTGNVALDEHLIQYAHHYLKRIAREKNKGLKQKINYS